MEGKNIKVYGTLINQTLNTDASMQDSQHNDLIAVAYQLFDERFNPKKGSGANGAVINIDRYQDIINKRLTAISYDPNGDTTNIYSNLYVDGDTNIGGDLTVEGDTTFEGDVNITGDINLNMGLNDLKDVTLSNMAIGQVLRYNGSEWINAKLSIDDLEMPAATVGLVLKFNGTKWVAGTDESSTGSGDNNTFLVERKTLLGIYDGSTIDIDPNTTFRAKYYHCQISDGEIEKMLNVTSRFKHSSGLDSVLTGGSYQSKPYTITYGDSVICTIPANSFLLTINADQDYDFDSITGVDINFYLIKSI